MAHRLKLYPDLARPRWRYVLADLAVLACIAAAIALGRAVYATILTLDVIANTAIVDGKQAGAALARVEQDVASLPLVGPSLQGDLNPVRGIPRSLTATGYRELQVIGHLATLIGIFVVAVPLLVLAFTYLPWRVRKIRSLSTLDHVLHQPGAGESAPTLQVLAARALYTLPYAQLVEYAPDPMGDWRAGHYDRLARATLAADGLDLEHYLVRTASGAPSGARDHPATADA